MIGQLVKQMAPVIGQLVKQMAIVVGQLVKYRGDSGMQFDNYTATVVG